MQRLRGRVRPPAAVGDRRRRRGAHRLLHVPLLFLTFFGECRADRPHGRASLHESPPAMTVPLVVLAVLSVVGGYVGLPGRLAVGRPLRRIPRAGLRAVARRTSSTSAAARDCADGGVGRSSAAAGIGAGVPLLRRARPRFPSRLAAAPARRRTTLLLNKYYVDEIYDATWSCGRRWRSPACFWRVVDVGAHRRRRSTGSAGWSQSPAATVWRRLQTGNVQHYALDVARRRDR